MRFSPYALALSLSLMGVVASGQAADAENPSAAGAGTILLGDARKKQFEFKAFGREDGAATGFITLHDPAGIPDQDVDGTGEPGSGGSPAGLEVAAEVDAMEVQGNRAVLSGVVTSTNHPRYAGLRMTLTVEDNGEEKQAGGRDRITWGFYPRQARSLVADAENPGAGMYAVGGGELGDRSLPLSSYSLIRIEGGDIKVCP